MFVVIYTLKYAISFTTAHNCIVFPFINAASHFCEGDIDGIFQKRQR